MEELLNRVYGIVDTCWQSFTAKVGHGLIKINKEASMQLHFANLLKNSTDLIIYHPDESVYVELETSILSHGKRRECDIVIEVKKGDEKFEIPIEMKCFKNISSSGKARGAGDLFKYGVYEDLQLLESYVIETRLQGIQLSMTDTRNFVHPKFKNGKSWDYDISDGNTIDGGIHIKTPIGGKAVSIKLTKSYHFNWTKQGNFYFLKIQGQ